LIEEHNQRLDVIASYRADEFFQQPDIFRWESMEQACRKRRQNTCSRKAVAQTVQATHPDVALEIGRTPVRKSDLSGQTPCVPVGRGISAKDTQGIPGGKPSGEVAACDRHNQKKALEKTPYLFMPPGHIFSCIVLLCGKHSLFVQSL